MASAFRSGDGVGRCGGGWRLKCLPTARARLSGRAAASGRCARCRGRAPAGRRVRRRAACGTPAGPTAGVATDIARDTAASSSARRRRVSTGGTGAVFARRKRSSISRRAASLERRSSQVNGLSRAPRPGSVRRRRSGTSRPQEVDGTSASRCGARMVSAPTAPARACRRAPSDAAVVGGARASRRPARRSPGVTPTVGDSATSAASVGSPLRPTLNSRFSRTAVTAAELMPESNTVWNQLGKCS